MAHRDKQDGDIGKQVHASSAKSMERKQHQNQRNSSYSFHFFCEICGICGRKIQSVRVLLITKNYNYVRKEIEKLHTFFGGEVLKGRHENIMERHPLILVLPHDEPWNLSVPEIEKILHRNYPDLSAT